ncbi:MAG: thermonuclease family protein [Candidatus Pacebacteria bacterium]|nr:thermonuclease family protein [Candidatus Paceibacterota bacterium]
MKKFLAILAIIFSLALPALALDIPDGAIVKTADNPDVYIVKHLNGNSYKRLVLNPQVFESYGHLKWENLITIDQAVMNSFATSDLVRVDGQTSIYRLTPDGDTGGKVLVSDFTGLNNDSVYTINNVDFGNYTETPTANLSELYDVYKVIDGDTITVTIDGVNQTIRLIGIDTPEVISSFTTAEYYGAEASAVAKEKLTGKKVRLESNPVSGDKDKYDRLLRYVYTDSGTLFNKWMIVEGYAKEYTYNGIVYKYQADFKAAQNTAKTEQKGLWASSVHKSASESITTPITKTPAVTVSGTYNCSGNVYNCGDFTSQAQAQAIYDYCMQTVGSDIHRLDSDKDEVVCESLQ